MSRFNKSAYFISFTLEQKDARSYTSQKILDYNAFQGYTKY